MDTKLGNLVWKITGDTTDFDAKVKTSDGKLTKFAGNATTLGTKLSLGLTLPLTALGGVAVKAASDLGESLNAIDVVFGEAAGTINDFGEIAATAAGLAQTEFNGLATVTGTLLKTTGQGIDQVAADTIELTKRAADVASVFNVDVKDALGAFNAALRGESEPARRFGVLLSENAVQAEIVASGIDKLVGLTEDQRKVQARYNIILRDTVQTQNDFANTQDSLANQTRILKADLQNTAAQLGTNLLPIVTEVVGKVRDLVGNFANLSTEQQRTVLAIAGIAAAIGPLLLVVGKSITAFNKLKASISGINTFLTGPAGLIIAAGLAVIALQKLGESLGETKFNKEIETAVNELENLKKEGELSVDAITEFARQTGITITKAIELVDEHGLLTDELRDQLDTINDINDASAFGALSAKEQKGAIEDLTAAIRLSYADLDLIGQEWKRQEEITRQVAEQIDYFTEAYGVSKEFALNILAAQEGFSEQQKIAINGLLRTVELQKEWEQAAQERIEAERKAQEEARKAREAEALAQAEREQEDENYRKLINDLYEEYAENIANIKAQERLGILSTIESLTEQKKAVQDYIDSLFDAGVRSQASFSPFLGIIEELDRLLGIAEEESAKIADNTIEAANNLNELTKATRGLQTVYEGNLDLFADVLASNDLKNSFRRVTNAAIAELNNIDTQRENAIKRSLYLTSIYEANILQIQQDRFQETSNLLEKEEELVTAKIDAEFYAYKKRLEEEEILEEERQAAIDALDAMTLENKKAIAEEEKKQAEDKAKALIAIAQNETAQIIKNAQDEEQRLAEIEDKKQKKRQETYDLIGQGVSAIDSLLSTSYDNRIKAAEGNEQEQYEIEVRRFKALKLLKAAEAAINTIEAVTAAGITTPRAIIRGIIGAANVAAILAATPQAPPKPVTSRETAETFDTTDTGEATAAAGPARNFSGGSGITVNQYNTLNTDSQENLERAARVLLPYINREALRNG